MNKRRKNAPALATLAPANPHSTVCCWFCGNTLNVPPKKYDGLCMSCWYDFHEDDIVLELFAKEVPA